MLATPFSIVLMFTLAAADPQAQAPPQPTTQPPPATAAPSADDAAARQRAAEQKLLQDWPNLARYRDDNAKLPPPGKDEKRVVFIGDSITDGWGAGRTTSSRAGPMSIAASAVRPRRRCSSASAPTLSRSIRRWW